MTQKIIQEQTLALYIKGLIKPIKVIVKARDRKTLQDTKTIANSE